MVTLRTLDSTRSQEDALCYPRQQCRSCQRHTLWLPTVHNTSLAFQPDPEPIRYDDGHGWAPGQFTVGGKTTWCFAPLGMHPPAKRRRLAHVMRLHHCGRKAA